jgi:hypothetical protein
LPCAAKLIDRRTWRARDAIALRWSGDRFVEADARPVGYDRPWAHGPREKAAASAQSHRGAQDASPRTEDLEEGD